jgi:hypothetical protein
MLVAPRTVGSVTYFGESVLRAREHHNKQPVWILLLQQEHLLSVCRGEPTLGFQNYVGIILESEVRFVFAFSLRLDVGERDFFVIVG